MCVGRVAVIAGVHRGVALPRVTGWGGVVVCASVAVCIPNCSPCGQGGVVGNANGEEGVGGGEAVWVPGFATVVRTSNAPFPSYDVCVAGGACGVVVSVMGWLHGSTLLVGECVGSPSAFVCDRG